MLYARAEAHARLGRLDEARADWSRLVSVQEPDQSDPAPMGSILMRGWTGDVAGFLSDAEAAVSAGEVDRDWLINFADSACTALRGESLDPVLADRLGSAAVAWLRDARNLGAYDREGSWVFLTERQFDPIARRPEFRALIADLSFPADPFQAEVKMPSH